jgi:lipopolysaccharide transport system ATP-binding protein
VFPKNGSKNQCVPKKLRMNSIISVENLGKKFVIDHQNQERYTTLRDVIARNAKKIFSFPKNMRIEKRGNTQEDFWALKDINFEIKAGDRVGIIGRNGAGKSTLLKVLSRITEPTSGRARINGRVASLLEVGTGFHPELTGRENIFLNGAILGMSRAEIRKKFDEIVDFAEVEQFLDTPVKRYSSGMYVRLAFAVAAHLEPEILVVDEVLAVGDIQFQKKCLGKMKDVSKNDDRTVLFVSHNLASLQSLCNVGILLSQGRLIEQNGINETVSKYLSQLKNNKAVIEGLNEKLAGEKVRLVDIRFKNEQHDYYLTEEITLEIHFTVLEELVMSHSISVFNQMDEYLLACPSLTDQQFYQQKHAPGDYITTYTLPSGLFNDLEYSITYLLVTTNNRIVLQIDKALFFKIHDDGKNRGDFYGGWMGSIRPILASKTLKIR